MRFFLSVAILPVSLAALAAAGPVVGRRSSFALQNGQDAQQLNAKFASLSADSPCTADEVACVQGAFAQCVDGKFKTTPCSGGLTCVALPLVNSLGTSVTCDTEQDAADRIARTGVSGGLRGRDLEARTLASAQKQKLGEALFRKVSLIQPQLADSSALNARVQEAVAVLHKAGF
ncbi:hypothetical protein GY45DRAFT_412934 [Cubamyces sp. BRFM 1775]|nr:hypothetical protein GY45DRAFT_412934 [Cubamyces sp. BRFM 1775]